MSRALMRTSSTAGTMDAALRQRIEARVQARAEAGQVELQREQSAASTSSGSSSVSPSIVAAAAAAVDTVCKPFSLDSLRMKAIFRLMHQVAVAINAGGVHDVFLMVRCQTLFHQTLVAVNPAADEEATIADSPQDLFLIHVLEVCTKQVGFAIMRALATIREFGSPLARSMGLYAIISSNNTLTDFVSLVNLIWLDTELYTFKQYKSVAVIRLMVNQQEQIIAKFTRLTAIPVADISVRKVVYEATRPPQPTVPPGAPAAAASLQNRHAAISQAATEDNPASHVILRGQAWPAMISWCRLLRQATHANLSEQRTNDDGMVLLTFMQMAADSEVGLQLDALLEGGSVMYSSAVGVLHEISEALGLQSQTYEANAVNLFSRLQTPLVRKVKFMEAVMLRYCLDAVYGKRSDSRNAVLRRTVDLLQSDLDYLVADVYGSSS